MRATCVSPLILLDFILTEVDELSSYEAPHYVIFSVIIHNTADSSDIKHRASILSIIKIYNILALDF
jgi:hypothetical protein